MKNRRTLIMNTFGACAVLAAGLITGFAGTADAKLVAPGTGCYATLGSGVNSVYRLNSYSANFDSSDTLTVVCPMAVDHTIASPVHFSIVVDDQNASDSFNCIGTVFDAQGNTISSTPAMASGTSATGVQTLSGSVAATPSTNNNYTVLCEVPPIGASISIIRTVSVY